ncbi:hypothetical protein BsWGS_23010 [Bradybaena similaris]
MADKVEIQASTRPSEDKLYTDAQKYWSTVSPTIDGMLGGFGNISPTDINGSKAFLRPFLKSSGGSVASTYALDCGAGIGRITKRLLLPIFDRVDMVEQDKHFCDTAREFIGPESSRVSNIFCSGLQNFKPSSKTYDVIWCQWVLGHLNDDDLVNFFSRCRQALTPGGIIVVKENTVAAGRKSFDDTDSSYTRTTDELKILMLKANLKILSVQKQKDFPKSLYPVYMFALR